MRTVVFIFLLMLTFGLSGFNFSNSSCVTEFTISGKMLNIEDMCENIPEGYDDMRIESIARNKTFYVRAMGDTKIIDSATSDYYGYYSITLPAGDYEFVTKWKTLPYVAPINTPTETWDTICHRVSHREPDMTIYLREEMTDVEFVFFKYCPWNEYCCTYTGPKPD